MSTFRSSVRHKKNEISTWFCIFREDFKYIHTHCGGPLIRNDVVCENTKRGFSFFQNKKQGFRFSDHERYTNSNSRSWSTSVSHQKVRTGPDFQYFFTTRPLLFIDMNIYTERYSTLWCSTPTITENRIIGFPAFFERVASVYRYRYRYRYTCRYSTYNSDTQRQWS